MPTIAANGLEIAYDVHGSGPPLVMLHGATSSGREDWAAQVPALSKEFAVFLPDARGHAGTRWDVADGWSTDWLVDDLGAFVAALGLGPIHLAGFSMGGHTALAFASRHPEQVRSLVVVGVSTQREPLTSVARRLMDPARIDATDPGWAARLDRRHGPVQGDGAWRRLMAALVADKVTRDLLGPRDLRRIELPALVAVGDRDPFAPVDHAWGLMRQLPGARLLVLPDCPHEAMVRRPGLFNEAIVAFYRSIEGRARHPGRQIRGGLDPADRGA